MADDLRELMTVVDGDAPDPAFVALLRARLEDELDAGRPVDQAGGLSVTPDVTLWPDEGGGRRRRWWMGGLVLAAAAAVLITLVTMASDDTTDTSTSDPADPSDAVLSETDALDLVESYYAAFVDGDTDAIRTVFAPEASVFEPITQTVEHHVQIMAWSHHQGSFLTDRECTFRDDGPGIFVIVCEFLLHEYLEDAVGAPPGATTDLFTVTTEGVVELRRRYESAGFQARRAFGVWMESNHPGVVHDVPVTELPTLEEVVAAGVNRREYADLWAVHLVENDCSFLVDC